MGTGWSQAGGYRARCGAGQGRVGSIEATDEVLLDQCLKVRAQVEV